MSTLTTKASAPLRHRKTQWFWFVGATIIMVVLFPLLSRPYNEKEVLIAAVGGVWGLAFFLQNRHKEDARFMKELFEYFNDRYDKQNDTLRASLRKKDQFSEQQMLTFIDYFNLCAEEWVFWKLGYIYDSIWEAWYNGMQQYGKDPRVAALWKEERSSNSYYGFEFPKNENGS